ncbi:MAG: class I SAM-dependent methyltransferase [Lachnospiraceae bacterium]|nr:class I SAM-dependent methyltransferase [Lachnospiraceae bacterium]
MSKKRSADIGLQFLQNIGFERISGKYGLRDKWVQLFGKERADQLQAEFLRLDEGTKEFYEFKYSDPLLNRSFDEFYDGDIIRKACNYVAEHKDCFGDVILEAGCGSGYMTVFLAQTFPESKIISIDRSEGAIRAAREMAAKYGVQNVSFELGELKDVSAKADTIFCMRTIQENIDESAIPFSGEPIIAQFNEFRSITGEYTDSLISRLNGSGSLVVFERIRHDPLMCGWLLGLNDKGCGISKDSYSEFTCNEAGGESVFQAFICRMGRKNEEQDIVSLWYESLGVNHEGKSELKGWSALSYLNENAGKMIRGVRFYGENGIQVGRLAAYTDIDDDSKIYCLKALSGQDVLLWSYGVELKEELLNEMQNIIDINVNNGLNCKEITDEG